MIDSGVEMITVIQKYFLYNCIAFTKEVSSMVGEIFGNNDLPLKSNSVENAGVVFFGDSPKLGEKFNTK